MHFNYRRLYAQTVFYPTFAWNFTLARILSVRNWWDPIDEHVLLGALPLASMVDEMKESGVQAVVNTCQEYNGPCDQYRRHSIDQLHVPTTDFTHPSLQDVEQAVEFVQEHVQRNRTVYIHCKAGRARSATVAICWLMKYRGMSPSEAQQHLLHCRSHVNSRLTDRPVVKAFAEKLTVDRR